MSRRGPLPVSQLDRARDGFKEFQLRTVDAVVAAMFDGDQRRFLVADEVGLGKTKIARAVVAETIRRLWDDESVDRLDVVYVCSNQQIARQNIEDLRVVGDPGRNVVDRITMLPRALAGLNTTSVNLVSFTPDTSLRLGNWTGRVGERAMLLKLISQPGILGRDFMSKPRVLDIFRDRASVATLRAELSQLDDFVPPAEVTRALGAAMKSPSDGSAEQPLIVRLRRLADGRRQYDHGASIDLVGRLRRTLAKVCMRLLSPDLIVLDEFQKFTNILDGKGEEGELAKLLLENPSARVLLLSATPYQLLTGTRDEENHFDGFLRTVGFLLGERGSEKVDVLRSSLAEMRRGMLEHRDAERVEVARDRVQHILRGVMVRTERLAVGDREGMLSRQPAVCTLSSSDVESYVRTDAVAQTMPRIPPMVEYWKSAPYLFNFMDEYVVKRRMKESLAAGGSEQLRAALVGPHMLDHDAVNHWSHNDARNARVRWLLEDLRQQDAFDLLWLPPSLRQTELVGAYARASGFTKRLIFSGWTVVPKSLAGILSFEYERKHHRSSDEYFHSTRTSRLDLPVLSGDSDATERFANLAVLLPSSRLAAMGDPITIARRLNTTLPLSIATLRQEVTSEVQLALEPLLAAAIGEGPTRNHWYAAAQFHLEPELAELNASDWYGDAKRASRGLADHLQSIRDLGNDPAQWGRPPPDLVTRLADIAIAGPAVAAVRSLGRLQGRFDTDLSGPELRRAAAGIAWAFRSHVTSPTADAIIGGSTVEGPWWVQLLAHCIEGGLGSVLDEWMHLIPDQLRLGRASPDPLSAVASCAIRVLNLEDGRVAADFFDDLDNGPRTQMMRTNFAMRFGQAKGAVAEGENPVDVRRAFNSPFRPFVLVSTSVGQEGLDFHHFAHAVVHWNLPTNPVALEQREGRVHRYKNHAVRKNIAGKFGGALDVVSSDDPWTQLFSMAEAAEVASDGIRPWWVFPGESKIQRIVPLLPMSREVGALARLTTATSLYRMTLGQPRQSELLEVLAGLDGPERDRLAAAVTIDLAPRARPAP